MTEKTWAITYIDDTPSLKVEAESLVKAVEKVKDKLSCANLRDADLRGADLKGADLSGADLGGANLKYANLNVADLSWSDLRGADLSGADLNHAVLEGADLRGAEGLPEIRLTLTQQLRKKEGEIIWGIMR